MTKVNIKMVGKKNPDTFVPNCVQICKYLKQWLAKSICVSSKLLNVVLHFDFQKIKGKFTE